MPPHDRRQGELMTVIYDLCGCERGASTAEYALVSSMLLLGTAGATHALHDGISGDIGTLGSFVAGTI